MAVPPHLLTAPGNTRRGRAAFSLALAALALLASAAAWQGFVHSAWGARLRAMNQIAFVGLPDQDAQYSALYVMQPDSSGARRLTALSKGSYFSPAWSPNGSQIAAFFVSDNERAAHLVVMDADGAHLRQIPAVALPIATLGQQPGGDIASSSYLISWSPDSSQLLAPVGIGQYALINADGTHLRTFSGILPTWSPDGKYLACYVKAPYEPSVPSSFRTRYNIDLLDTQTLRPRRLGQLSLLNADALAWSPDGRYLALSNVQQETGRGQPNYVLMLAPLDGSDPRTVAQWGDVQIQEIAWSPDSAKLAVVLQNTADVQSGAVPPGSGSELWVVNTDGAHRREVGFSNDGRPSWSPDGKRLIFVTEDNTILLIADTSPQLTPTLHPLSLSLAFLLEPVWSPLAAI